MTFESFTENDLKFRFPFGGIVSGASNSGKTHFILRLLENLEMFEPKPKEIVYCYGEYGAHVFQLEKQGIETFPGPPTEEIFKNRQRPFLLIIDDCMLNIDENFLAELYTRKIHHSNLGVFFLTQNLFDKKLKVPRQNAQYLILLNAPNSLLQVSFLSE
jgi:hypothetical protein